MTTYLHVSAIHFEPAGRTDTVTGLLGWCSFLLNNRVQVDGVAIRRKLDGGLTLSWPARTLADGRRRPCVHPINNDARRDLEAQVLSALRLQEAAP